MLVAAWVSIRLSRWLRTILAAEHRGEDRHVVQSNTETRLSAADVAHLGKLARIELSTEELERLAPQLEVILDSVTRVREVAGADVEPTSNPLPLSNIFRPDQVTESLPAAEALAGAPAVEDQRFRVPRILGEEQ